MSKSGVYILKSLKNFRHYIGSTDNIERRLKEHNTSIVKSTYAIRPLALQRFVECNTLSEAKSFEYRLKKYKRRDILEKVIDDGIFPWDHQNTGP